MSLNPATYEIALERAQARQKARTPLRSRRRLKTSPASISRKQGLSRKAAKKLKKKKKLTTGQWKKKAWTEFSIWVRTRDANTDGTQTCVTCDTVSHWKTMQAGHFLRGRLNANLFSELGTWPQCYACNVGRDGNVVEYYEWMLAHHGKPVIDDLREKNSRTHKWLPGELQGIWEKYKALNAENPLLGDE